VILTRRFHLLWYAGILITLLASSCAHIVAPSGGPKDEVPPKVLKENPENKSTSFTGTKITIKFDEFVQLKDADDQVVVSPPMDEKPIIEVSGKSIVIELRGNLKPNTTYTINFGNSIVDNHENTVLSNYSYVFATGLVIDTLTVKGSIHQAFNDKPEKGILVCLYPTDSFADSTIIKQKPLYFTKTNEAGQFTIYNLPAEEFTLVAFKDDNKNLKYDKAESIAFYDSVVYAADSLPIATLGLFKPSLYARNKLVDTIGRNTGLFRFVVFNPYNVSIKPLDESLPYYSWTKAGKENLDTITVFSNEFTTDSVWFRYTSSEQDTTFFVKPAKTAKPLKFESSIKKNLELNDTFTIQFNQPLARAITDTPMLVLKEDTIQVSPKIIYSAKGDYLQLYYPLKEHTSYTLSYKDSAFTDIYGNCKRLQHAGASFPAP
jgi:hypothetical protein